MYEYELLFVKPNNLNTYRSYLITQEEYVESAERRIDFYIKKDEINRFGLKSFGIQGMIRDGELFPIEVNRRGRFAQIEVNTRDRFDQIKDLTRS